MDEEIKSLIKQRQSLNKNDRNDEWKELCKKIKKKIKIRKKKYFNKITNHNIDWWKELKKIQAGTNNGPQINKDQAESINRSFYNVWDNVKQPDLEIYKNSISRTSEIPKITLDQVYETLTKLKANKAQGPDGVGARLLKAGSIELTEVVHHLFLESLKQCVVPSQWKEADIIPIPKIPRP